jgi:hypothetical protein
MAVLILGGTDDAHANHMLEWLRGRKADVEMLDSRWFPTVLQLAYEPETAAGSLRFPTGRRLAWTDVTSVYWRCYNGISGATLPDPEQSFIASNDARSLFESFQIQIPARWVNGWRAYQLHQTKPVQLAMVAALGVPIPATILTNDPEKVRAFAARHANCIFKPVQGGAHTRRLTAEHLDDSHLSNLAFAPVTVQEEVPGTNIRVFVAGERILACEVSTEAIDFRDDQDPRIVPCALPDDVAGWCLRAARALDLLWTGIDLRRTPDGRHFFLEANPSPMFMGFESRSGLQLTAALGDLLLGK